MTKRAAFVIAGQSVEAGTRKTIEIPVSTLSDPLTFANATRDVTLT